MGMGRDHLPTIGEYLDAVSSTEEQRALWKWLSSVPADVRRGAYVLDLEAPESVGWDAEEEWLLVAEHPWQAIWIVKRV